VPEALKAYRRSLQYNPHQQDLIDMINSTKDPATTERSDVRGVGQTQV